MYQVLTIKTSSFIPLYIFLYLMHFKRVDQLTKNANTQPSHLPKHNFAFAIKVAKELAG